VKKVGEEGVDLRQQVEQRLVHARRHPPVLRESLEPSLLEVEMPVEEARVLGEDGEELDEVAGKSRRGSAPAPATPCTVAG
jgi:hypothetical protein